MINYIIGQNIRKFRQYRGYQQPEFAELIGVSVVTLSKYENGRVSITVDMLLTIAKLLCVSWAALLVSEEMSNQDYLINEIQKAAQSDEVELRLLLKNHDQQLP